MVHCADLCIIVKIPSTLVGASLTLNYNVTKEVVHSINAKVTNSHVERPNACGNLWASNFTSCMQV